MLSKKQKLFGIVICLYTGLRIGELLALTWDDVDIEKGEINVSKSCYCGKGGIVVDSAKTEHSKRVIPLCKQLIKILRKTEKESNSEYVISSNGKPVTTRSYQGGNSMSETSNKDKNRIRFLSGKISEICRHRR